MKISHTIVCLSLLMSPLYAGKFDGLSLGASIGGNIASLKDSSVTDGVKQLGANGKLYAGIGKSFLDMIFVGAEAFGRYGFFVKPENATKESIDGSPQFGGYLKAGLRPTENLLIYGLYGVQSSSAKIKGAFEKLFEPSEGAWSTFFGAGIEYAIGVGTAARLEGLYEPKTSFTVKELPNLSYDTNFFFFNVGIVIYM